ncbi:LytR/AlgR family response regulator transcription factor [Pedobacter nototheniae]|uniref:LytR/AlgR family response regulator transcription factor n=1 Tax=Pedobacter nototheniae TaxID=2488994 RepID=UPI00292E5C10|nr:response regulator [Pedobacter nototheniae]
MKTIRTIIIDDERAARQEIIRMLANYPQIIVLAESANADEAESMIELLKPDLIFLDIQMPGRSGFELLETLQFMPQVIFITAFDRYAIKAFEVNAMDYLLKPVRIERFAKAIDKVIENLNHAPQPSVFVRDKGDYHLVKWKDIYLINSVENYASLHFGEKTLLIKKSLNKIEADPDCQMFFRASRGQMFNMDHVSEIKKDNTGMFVQLRSGDVVRISERQGAKFRQLKKG